MARVVAFEGIECSGKTTSINIIHRKLSDYGYNVYSFSKDNSEIDVFLKAALSVEDLLDKEKILLMLLN